MKTARQKFLEKLLKGGRLDLNALPRKPALKKSLAFKDVPEDPVSFLIHPSYERGQLISFCEATPAQSANSITSYLMLALSEDQKTLYCGAVAGVINGNVPPGMPLAVTAYTELFDPDKDGRTLVIRIHGNLFVPPNTSLPFDYQETFNI